MGSRTLGVDYGLRRVGLAISIGVAPRPLHRINHSNNPQRVADDVANVANRNLAKEIVVGMPVDINGDEKEQAIKTRHFVQELVRSAPWAKIMVLNETFTSKDAKERLHQLGITGDNIGALLDSESAVMLLQRHFSDKDDYRAEVVHKPNAVTTDGYQNEARMTFAGWKKQAMQRAAQSAHFGKKSKKRRP
ncbi:Holliday junction resolvase [Gracilaria domingensis]|nr:Holliday junction resolvase [Gracilaria domingensis]